MPEILTTKGMMDEALLEKRDVPIQTATGSGTAKEWWFQGELVKRDVNFTPTTGKPKGSP